MEKVFQALNHWRNITTYLQGTLLWLLANQIHRHSCTAAECFISFYVILIPILYSTQSFEKAVYFKTDQLQQL